LNIVKRLPLFSLLAALAVAGCRSTPTSEPLGRYEFSEPHMGSLWRITLYAPSSLVASNAAQAAFARVMALDRMMTDYDPDSELMRLCKAPPGVPVKVSPDLFRILKWSQEVSLKSDGAFDVTCGPVVQLWRRARRQRQMPAPERLAAARQAVGFRKLVLNEKAGTVTLLGEQMRLDLGGVGKGYGADEALKVLKSMGLTRALVAASGDLAIGEAPPGKPGWRVAIGLPGSPTTNLAGVLMLRHKGVSTSGDTEQYVELDGVRYSHIVDPRTGQALTNRFQATVVADCATHSDSLTKTVCVLGPEAGLRLVDSVSGAAALLLVPGPGTNLVELKSRRFPAFHQPQRSARPGPP
jgi:FAD:protein FMN transferase